MNVFSRFASLWRSIPAVVALATLAQGTYAQDPSIPHVNPGGIVAMSGFLIFCFVMALVGYVYVALALQTIANKTNTANAWLAWIPLANIVLMLIVARKPIWWLLLLVIPLVNIVVGVIVWMAVAEARGKPGWWGIVVLVPVIGIIVPGYLAWSD
jgi:hypothetical protein